ncbi:MAG: transcriptional regulator [Candidatus Rokuibacteriota bacterium]|nr:MAG: transcriptional regulator [Candidatus Rokubacteria bacterium]PYO10343.1 MAG: transcriptional regulator [Candidatus Rokubacteria bacterium]
MNGVRMRLQSRVPRYHRIAEVLRERIRVGELPSGARLDNQRQLAKSFGVTLMTLRQALELLEREHLITRRHGLGTFVAAPSIDYDILQLRRFAGDLSAKGEHVATRLLGTRFAAADRRVAEALRLAGRPRVLVLERLRLVDEHPMSLQRSFLPSPLGDEVIRADLALTPLHQVLEFKLGVVITRASETVSAVRLGRREARDLDCRAGEPAFESERVSYDAGGAPVVFDRAFIPGDRFRITRELHYEGATS